MLYISTKFCEIISNWYQSNKADTISILKISKGNNSAKNVGGVTVYICAKFREIISSSIKVMKRTRMFNG